jgi:hypothetical protein
MISIKAYYNERTKTIEINNISNDNFVVIEEPLLVVGIAVVVGQILDGPVQVKAL